MILSLNCLTCHSLARAVTLSRHLYSTILHVHVHSVVYMTMYKHIPLFYMYTHIPSFYMYLAFVSQNLKTHTHPGSVESSNSSLVCTEQTANPCQQHLDIVRR